MISRQKECNQGEWILISEQMTRVVIRILMNTKVIFVVIFGSFCMSLEKSFKTRDWEVIKLKAIVTFYDFLINIKCSDRAEAKQICLNKKKNEEVRRHKNLTRIIKRIVITLVEFIFITCYRIKAQHSCSN